MILKEFEQKKSVKTRRCKVLSIKKKKKKVVNGVLQRIKQRIKGLCPTLSLTTWQTHYKHLAFEPWFPFVKMGQ